MERVGRLRSAELFLITAVALALGTAMIGARLGLSPTLRAFMVSCCIVAHTRNRVVVLAASVGR
jgi:Kef-type K+ transport system membrane component KefB